MYSCWRATYVERNKCRANGKYCVQLFSSQNNMIAVCNHSHFGRNKGELTSLGKKSGTLHSSLKIKVLPRAPVVDVTFCRVMEC